ncbi:hypothetical protein EZ428_20420 [Pedobacter frigiditerrae]|uniref:CarboxypepD_reg-like domain-containing protein n=1 Tax=Pedobacter frigiditerrae TaxID=2530452 RepID=A0A4R0MMX1_9SPHI|nr:hypothetical protein [Pedobacter frigiditerrae]TCC88088.1 hypothetical protein EZ428_20420 [Pedobacter frigiditerrae]
MKLVVFIFSFILLFQLVATAQIQIKGQVLDQVTRKGLENVEILNTSRRMTAQTDTKGDFIIKAKVGDVIIYRLAGYDTDTALIIDLKQIRRFLHPLSNTLNTVSISGQVDSKKQYADIYNKANPVLLTPGRGLRFYPSTFFGKEGKDARRLKKLIESDQAEKEIDKKFNAVTVTNLLPLKQPELDAFLMLYRPDLKFVVNSDADDFKFYLLEAYERFKALPPDQKVLPNLKNPF